MHMCSMLGMVTLIYGLPFSTNLLVQMSMNKHFGNPASLNYQLNPSKKMFPSLLGDTEKLDEPCFLSYFCTDPCNPFHAFPCIPCTSGIQLFVHPHSQCQCIVNVFKQASIG